MKEPRDSQRKKIYDSEPNNKRGKRFHTVHEIQEFVDSIIDSFWYDNYRVSVIDREHHDFQKDCRLVKVEVRDGRGRRSANGNRIGRRGIIKLPKYQRRMLIILHEVAHTIQSERPAHGQQFAKIYLDLVQMYADKKVAQNLKIAFKKNCVKYG